MPKYKEKSKTFVCRKIAESIPEKIPEEKMKCQVSELLFERDYNEVEKLLADYRKGEIRKKKSRRCRR